ncbi:hypothetical protein ACHAW5_007144 [Stephanodiscus triporus]|uniref:Holocytochrome c-type synthase n=1 Tax=Stephanodiscus triporus TaxID=2934178 RepID=A0ABD3QYV4_9STRA
MGADQSKHPPKEPPSASASASVPSADHSCVVISESSSTIKPGGGGGGGDGGGEGGGGGCPMKNPDGSYRAMPGFASMFGGGGYGRRHPPIAAVDGADLRSSSASTPQQQQQQQRRLYDVYSRPLPVDPTNGMPLSNPDAIARNSLPAPNHFEYHTQGRGRRRDVDVSLAANVLQTLVRKGKVDEDTREEDMTSVVAIHNCMNEGTWREDIAVGKVLGDDDDDEDGQTRDGVPSSSSSSSSPRLTKFLGRPTDLSPKAYVKHHLFGHPLPFDRHDWTVSRTSSVDGSSRDVRYVIDYYHDSAVANAEIGSARPRWTRTSVRGDCEVSSSTSVPAAGQFEEVWGRAVLMPLARRGCGSIFECLVKGGRGDGARSDFEPLPLAPSESLRAGLRESVEVWENIQRDAATGGGLAPWTAEARRAAPRRGRRRRRRRTGTRDGRAGDVVDGRDDGRTMTGVDATRLAVVYSSIVSQCEKSREAMRTCASESECHKAHAGMTVCAGKFACPLQHSSFMASLDAYATGSTSEDVAEARIDAAMEILGECVSGYDRDASSAMRRFPDLFDGAVLRGVKK